MTSMTLPLLPLSLTIEAAEDPQIAVVGRTRRWLADPTKIYPVSCTNVVVEDTYFDIENGCSHFETICGSREFVTRALKGNAGVAVHLHKLRPKGSANAHGLEAQGTPNFVEVFSAINKEVRRGNSFRNGAVLVYTDFSDPDLLEFIGQYECPRGTNYRGITAREIPYCKRAVMVNVDSGELTDPKNKKKLEALIRAVDLGDIFVAKITYDANGERLYTQVCVEVLFKSLATCNLMHVNLAKISSIQEINPVFTKAIKALIALWANLDHSNSPYKGQDEDRQVGLGVIGLANLLAHLGVTYQDFTAALRDVRCGVWKNRGTAAWELASALYGAFYDAGNIAKAYGLERAFTVAPTSNSSTAYTDLLGLSVAPEISPPVAMPSTRSAIRQSGVEGERVIQYREDIQLAHYDVDFDTYFELACEWQLMMDQDGLGHAISFNVWNEQVVDSAFFARWVASPLISLYYRWKTQMDQLSKTSVQLDIAEEDEWSFDTEEADGPCIPCGEA